MEPYQTEYGEKVGMTLAAYPMGSPGLVMALENLCANAERKGFTRGKEAAASDVCEQLHEGMGKGLKCLSCYYSEVGYNEVQAVEAEIAKFAKEKSESEEGK